MTLINDGKWKIFSFVLFKVKYELLYFATSDCSNTLRNKGVFIFNKWVGNGYGAYAKLKSKKEYNFIKLK